MAKNEINEDLIKDAPNVADQARLILDSQRAQTPIGTTPNANTDDPRPLLATDQEPRRKRGRPRKILDPIILAKLGQNVAVPRKILRDEKIVSSGEETAPEAQEGGGGIPPESTGGAKNFGSNHQVPSEGVPKKKSKKKPGPLAATRQHPDFHRNLHPTDPDVLLRQRLLGGMRDHKMRQLFELMLTNPGLTINEAKTVIGYSTNSKTTNIIKSKSWQTMIDSVISPEEIGERERFLLYNDDPRIVNASLDRYHKIKGSFNHTQTTNVNVSIDGEIRQMSDQVLYEMIDANEVIEGELINDGEEDKSE